MNLLVCAVRDSAIDEFMNPMFVRTQNEIIRLFGNEVNNPESPFYQHPEDYELFLLGQFKTSSGEFETHNPVSLCTARSLLK